MRCPAAGHSIKSAGCGRTAGWLAPVMVVVLEMGMNSPPVGINVFVVRSIAPEVPMNRNFRGIWPFWFAMAAMIGLLVIFPQIALFLPQTIVVG